MSCPELVARAMAVRTSAHMAHLITSSYAAHVALQEFYEGIVELADRLAETHMGEMGLVSFPSLKPPTGKPDAFLTEFLTAVQDEAKEEAAKPAKASILADIEELTLRTLYKLRTFA